MARAPGGHRQTGGAGLPAPVSSRR